MQNEEEKKLREGINASKIFLTFSVSTFRNIKDFFNYEKEEN